MTEPFIPKLTPYKDYVGNIKAKHNSKEFKQLKKFLGKYFENYIITIEHKDKESEHCHFWANQIKLKDTEAQRNTLANYFRRDLPTLKREGKGGENKYLLQIMKEEFQFYYIMKEQDEKTLKDITTFGYNVNKKQLNNYLKNYNIILNAKRSGKAGEFKLYCIDLYGVQSHLLKNRNIIIEAYMDWCEKSYTCPTINLADRYVNGVLLTYAKSTLTKNFKDILNNKYNKEYF